MIRAKHTTEIARLAMKILEQSSQSCNFPVGVTMTQLSSNKKLKHIDANEKYREIRGSNQREVLQPVTRIIRSGQKIDAAKHAGGARQGRSV
jgi:hypothetical protein